MASLVAQMVKNLPAVQETWVQSLGREDPQEKGMATHFSILARRIPWTEEPGRLQSMGLQRVGPDWAISIFISWVCCNTMSRSISGIKPWNPALQVDSLPSEPPGKPSHIINLPFFNNCLFKIYSRYPQILNPFKISTSSVYFIVAVVVAAVVFLCIHSSYIFTKIRRMWKKSHKFLLLFLSSFFLCHCWDCWDT